MNPTIPRDVLQRDRNAERCLQKSKMVFRDGVSNSLVRIHDHAWIEALSDGLPWQGLHLEIGSGFGWEGDDVMVDGHFVGINRGDEAWYLDVRDGDEWTVEIVPPRSLWIIPEGCIFSVHHRAKAYWANAVIDGQFLDSAMGCHFELRGGYGLVDPFLEHLFQALIADMTGSGDKSALLTKSLIQSFVLALAIRHGVPAGELSQKGGIAPRQLSSLLKWIAANLDAPITVDQMASRLGLSAAHFSREFKQSTGHTPWGYVIEARLQRVAELLRTGESICSIAVRCGFFDQAHLARLFKRRFGVAPSSFLDRGKGATGRSLCTTPSSA